MPFVSIKKVKNKKPKSPKKNSLPKIRVSGTNEKQLRSAIDESPPCVDHIKPVRKYWHLRLDPDNLQVLCADCNRAKGNWDETDFRKNRKKSGKRNRRECFKDSRLTSSLVREYSL